MTKSPDAFRTISEVAEWLGIQAHVLRFWESKFTQIKPVKRAGGRRYYRPSDMLLLGGIKKLLHDDGLTIKGAQKLLREQGVATVSDMSQPLDELVAEISEEEAVATVLRFQNRSASAGRPLAGQDEPELIELDEAPAAETEISETGIDPSPDPEADDAEDPKPANDPATRDNDDMAEDTGDDESGDDPDDDDDEDFDTPAADAVLPSFLNRGVRASIDQEAPPRARVVDAPDPPARLEVQPGALSHVCALSALTPDQARAIAPLAAALQDWVTRVEAGASA